MFYPPRGWSDGQERIEGPTPSLRWELLREGIEDYEYFARLAQAADALDAAGETLMATGARALLDVPSSIYTSLTSYNDDSALLHAHRELVGSALEQATAVLVVLTPDGGSGGGDSDLSGDGTPGDTISVGGDETRGDTFATSGDATVSGAGDSDLALGGQLPGQGCGCSTSPSANGWFLLGLGLVFMRRRRVPIIRSRGPFQDVFGTPHGSDGNHTHYKRMLGSRAFGTAKPFKVGF